MLRNLIIHSFLIGALGLEAHAQVPTPPGGQPAKPPQEEPPPAMSVPPSYQYDSRGRRDPFVNPVPKRNPEPEIPVLRPPGLKGVLMSEAQITGVVVSKEAPELNRIMIQAPGGKTYFARNGDALFDSVIKDIQRDAVVFLHTSKDREGRTTTREVVRKISPTP